MLAKAGNNGVGRLVGQEVTGACKVKAQSGALLRVGSAVVPFCLESG
jgi:hypothetical protein